MVVRGGLLDSTGPKVLIHFGLGSLHVETSVQVASVGCPDFWVFAGHVGITELDRLQTDIATTCKNLLCVEGSETAYHLNVIGVVLVRHPGELLALAVRSRETEPESPNTFDGSARQRRDGRPWASSPKAELPWDLLGGLQYRRPPPPRYFLVLTFP